MPSIVGSLAQFKQFACETRIHGIRRLFEGKPESIVFWAVVVLTSFCMATKDLIQLVSSYKLELTTIQISLSNDTFAWKSPTLCMEFLATYSNKTSNAIGWSDRPDIDWSSNTLGMSADSFDEFYGLADMDNYTTVDFADDASTNVNVMYYTYMMLGYLSELEQKLVGENQAVTSSHQFTLGYNDVLMTERVQKFYEFYKRRFPAVTLTKLSKVFGMWFCLHQLRGVAGMAHFGLYTPSIYGQFENYRYFGDHNYINLPLCKANMITHLGFSMVCSKVFESPTVPFVPDYNYFAIYNSFKTYPPVFTDEVDYSSFTADYFPNIKWYLDIDGRSVLPPASDRTNVFSWNPSEHVVVDISVATEYRYLNRGVSPCSSAAETQSQCQRRKRVEFVYQQCGCWPSLVEEVAVPDAVCCSDFNFFDQTLPAATKIYNLTVDKFQCGATSNQADVSGCLPDCQVVEKKKTRQLTKKFMWNRWWSSSRFIQKSGSIEFRYTADPHLLVSETRLQPWSTFIGTWGGSIGTWLGESLF